MSIASSAVYRFYSLVFMPYLLNAVVSVKSPFLFQDLVVLKPLVSLVSPVVPE